MSYHQEPVPKTYSVPVITALAHFYRGQLNAEATASNNVDAVTSWALTLTTALVALAMTIPSLQLEFHYLCWLALFWLWARESLRQMDFAMAHFRVRAVEARFYAAVFASHDGVDVITADDWHDLILSLVSGESPLSFSQALHHRLRRHYIGLFWLAYGLWLIQAIQLYSMWSVLVPPVVLTPLTVWSLIPIAQ